MTWPRILKSFRDGHLMRSPKGDRWLYLTVERSKRSNRVFASGEERPSLESLPNFTSGSMHWDEELLLTNSSSSSSCEDVWEGEGEDITRVPSRSIRVPRKEGQKALQSGWPGKELEQIGQ